MHSFQQRSCRAGLQQYSANSTCRRTLFTKFSCCKQSSDKISSIRVLKPSSDMAAVEAVCKTLGQAYIAHPWHRKLNAQLGREQAVFAGFSRMLLDKFSHEPVLYTTPCSSAAAIALTDSQQLDFISDLQDLDFTIIPGSLQMLTAMPENSMPVVVSLVQQVCQPTAQAVQAALPKRPFLQVVLLGVRPADQGRGLGSALLKAVAGTADAAGLPLAVQLLGQDLVPFMQKHGFERIGGQDLLHPVMLRVTQKL